MEPSALKDYLESLLSEHNERLMGGSVKHMGSDHCPPGLCYKEVLPTPPQQPAQPQVEATQQEQTPQVSSPECHQSCTVEAYQNYAANALKNVTNTNTTDNPATNNATSETIFSGFSVEATGVQIEQLVRQQLERIEQMIREMYTTNQELFKSIILYCREHTEDN